MAAGLPGLDVPADLALASHADRPGSSTSTASVGSRLTAGQGDSGFAAELERDHGLLADSQRPGLVPEGELAQEQGHRQGHHQHRHHGEDEQPPGRQQEPPLRLAAPPWRCP